MITHPSGMWGTVLSRSAAFPLAFGASFSNAIAAPLPRRAQVLEPAAEDSLEAGRRRRRWRVVSGTYLVLPFINAC